MDSNLHLRANIEGSNKSQNVEIYASYEIPIDKNN